MKPITYYETNSTSPEYNLAFEEYILKEKTSGDILILWQNDNAIIIGQNQNAVAEINESFVRENGICVIRRTTGGGAVYHDLGNLNYSFITDKQENEDLNINHFIKPVVDVLCNLGLDAKTAGRNDIYIGEKKVSGCAQRIVKGRILHHGTLLFDSKLDVVSKALNADPNKFRGKASQSVRSRVTNIRNHLSKDMDIADFKAYIKDNILGDHYICGSLNERDFDKINELKKSKYDTVEWNFGKSPKYETKKKKAFPFGIVEAVYTVEKGMLVDVEFFGDFLSRKTTDDISSILKNTVFNKEDILRKLEYVNDFSDYFGEGSTGQMIGEMFFE